MQRALILGTALLSLATTAQSANHEAASKSDTTNSRIQEVVDFWREAGPALWFAKDPAFDQRFRDRFERTYEEAARGKLDEWATTPDGALALLILLDQFPRNAYRDTPRMYATDAHARRIADAAIRDGHDSQVPKELRLFMYLPFGHSEDLQDQERSVALAATLGEPSASRAKHHRDIILRFGRFPHRNPISVGA